MFRHRFVVAIAAIAAVLLIAADAHARAGGGSSGGSRGTRTFSAPPVTQTAPNSAAPMQRTLTQPGKAGTVGQTARPGLFGGGLLGGLAAGFLGAGLFGLLFGHGLFGGMAGFASVLGLMLQLALVVIVARLLFTWWQRRHAPAPRPHSRLPVIPLAVSAECSRRMRQPARRLRLLNRTTTTSNACLVKSRRLTRPRTSIRCARRSRRRCCPISPSSSPRMRVAA